MNLAGFGQACRFCGSKGFKPCDQKTYCTDSSRTCCNIGETRVVRDESCIWNPKVGCNAGGQGQTCRFVYSK